MTNLRKLSEQQKEQRAIIIKNRSSKPTHDIKFAESFSPITKKLDVVKETTQNLGGVIKKTNTPQPAIENTHTALPVENEKIETVVFYDTSLEKTLSNNKNKTGFF